MKQGLSAEEAHRRRMQAQQERHIPSVASTLQDIAAKHAATQRARAGADEIDEEKKLAYRDAPRSSHYVPPDMGWKKQDYEQLVAYYAAKQSDLDFDAEVGDPAEEAVDLTQSPSLTSWWKMGWNVVAHPRACYEL